MLGVHFEESFTNFVLLKVPSDSSMVAKGLLRKGVIVRDMAVWGLRNYIRVTIGSHRENVLLIKALKEVLRRQS